MAVRESRSRESERFVHWMRTGPWLALEPDPPETKFNPYHDPTNGRFTFAPGGSAGGGSTPRSHLPAKPSSDGPLGKIQIVKMKPLNAADRATYNGVMGTASVRQAMDDAWKQSENDGRERGFFIYTYDGRYFKGPTVTGTEDELGPLYDTLVRANPLTGDLRQVAAWFHTHPGDYDGVSEADNYDQNFAKRVFPAITIIKSKKGTLAGR